jgi:hypothetical protein
MKKLILLVTVSFLCIVSYSQTQWYQLNGREKQQYYADSLYAVSSYSTLTSLRMVVKDTLTNKVYHQAIPTFSGITADNGLTASTSTNVQLGGTLLQNTTIDATASYMLTVTGSLVGSSGYSLKATTTNTTDGIAFGAVVSGSSTAIQAIATTGNAINAQTTSGNGIGVSTTSGTAFQASTTSGKPGSFNTSPASTNTTVTVLDISRNTSGTAANNIAGAIDYYVATTAGFGRLSNQLISKLSDATDTTRTSQFIITGVNSAVTQNLVTIDGDGTSTFLGPSSPTNTVRAINTTGTGVRGESTTGNAINGAASSSGNGGVFSSISGNGLQASSVSSFAAELIKFGSTTNDVLSVAKIRRETAGTAAAGEGGSLDFYLEDASNTILESNKLVSIWTDAANATRTSKFTITGVSSATTQDWLTIGQSGYLKVRPMTVTEAGALTPAEGMIIFVSNTNGTFTSIGLWDYENGAWHKL